MGKGRGSPDFSLSIKALAETFENVTIVYPEGGGNLEGLPESIKRAPFKFGFKSRLIEHSNTKNIIRKTICFAINWFYDLVIHFCFTVKASFKAISFKDDYSLVVCYGPRAVSGARLFSWYRGLPLVIRLFGLALGAKGYGFIQRMIHFEETLALSSDAWSWIITNDGSCGDVAADIFNIPEERLFFPLCAVESPGRETSFSRDEFCRKHGIDTDSRIVVRVSRLWVQQRIDRMIDCLPKVTDDGRPVVALIVGDGPERTRLEQLAGSSEKEILFLGSKSREELEETYLAADLYLATSDRTNLSNSVLEAFVYGVPVVALDKGGTSSLIRDNENGFLVKDDNLDKMRQVILKILSNSELYERISANAKTSADSLIPDFRERKLAEAKAVLSVLGKEI